MKINDEHIRPTLKWAFSNNNCQNWCDCILPFSEGKVIKTVVQSRLHISWWFWEKIALKSGQLLVLHCCSANVCLKYQNQRSLINLGKNNKNLDMSTNMTWLYNIAMPTALFILLRISLANKILLCYLRTKKWIFYILMVLKACF